MAEISISIEKKHSVGEHKVIILKQQFLAGSGTIFFQIYMDAPQEVPEGGAVN